MNAFPQLLQQLAAVAHVRHPFEDYRDIIRESYGIEDADSKGVNLLDSTGSRRVNFPNGLTVDLYDDLASLVTYDEKGLLAKGVVQNLLNSDWETWDRLQTYFRKELGICLEEWLPEAIKLHGFGVVVPLLQELFDLIKEDVPQCGNVALPESMLRQILQGVEAIAATMGADTKKRRSNKHNKGLPKRSATQAHVDAEIQEYIAKRAGLVRSLTEAVTKGKKDAVKNARKVFGRNHLTKVLRLKSATMVSKSEPWRKLANELELLPSHTRRLTPSNKIGLEIAVERKSAVIDDLVEQEASRRESARIVDKDTAIAYAKKRLNGRDAGRLIPEIENGSIPPENVLELVATISTRLDDGWTRRRRSSELDDQ